MTLNDMILTLDAMVTVQKAKMIETQTNLDLEALDALTMALHNLEVAQRLLNSH